MYYHPTVSHKDVHDWSHGILQRSLKFQGYGRSCPLCVLISILLYAAARMMSISAACQRLRGVPSDETARKALLNSLPQPTELERRLNAGLDAAVPERFSRKKWRVAVDLTEIPYYGQPHRHSGELRKNKPKQGTSHFHAYATACVVDKGYRFTLAMTWVEKGELLADVLKRLLRKIRHKSFCIKCLLLDRAFYNTDVIGYLQSARIPFLMPVSHRGRAPKKRARSCSTRRFLSWRKSGWSKHTMQSNNGRKATFNICVSGRYFQHQGKRRRKVMVFAYWGFRPGSPRWVRETYRKRFGIETSYRQMNAARIRTSTRDPHRRLLFVGIALLLRNLWAWIHLEVLATRHSGGGLTLQLQAIPLGFMLQSIEVFLDNAYQFITRMGLQPRPPT